MRRFLVCLPMCQFVLVFFSPFSIAIASLEEERANLSAFHTFVRFVLVWICRFPLSLGVWEGLRFVIVAVSGLFSYLLFHGYVYHYPNRPRWLSWMRVRLETRRSRVRPPPRSATFFRGD